jgi:hypothetical protein
MAQRLRITETELLLFYHGVLPLSEVLPYLQENDRFSHTADRESKLLRPPGHVDGNDAACYRHRDVNH